MSALGRKRTSRQNCKFLASNVRFRPGADIALGYYNVGASDKEVKAWRLQT